MVEIFKIQEEISEAEEDEKLKIKASVLTSMGSLKN